jgi:uncharacterized membrane protein
MNWSKLQAALAALALMLIPLVLLYPACSAQQAAAEHASATAGDVVNEVAKRGDQVYAVTTEACFAAERAASVLPDLEQAKSTVLEIRSRCDVAFAALEELRLAVARVDKLVADIEQGAATVQQATEAALASRAAFEQARSAHESLAVFLEQIK